LIFGELSPVRIITQTRIYQAIKLYPQWAMGLQLWLEVYKQKSIDFDSYHQIRQVWINASGWNVDRIASKKVIDNAFKGNFDTYIFDIHKNDCRIVTKIEANSNKVFVRHIFTHANYDKWCKQNITT
jgi:mRNA interferase HigB